MTHPQAHELPAIEIVAAVPDDARSIREVQHKTWLATYPSEEVGITKDDIEDYYKDSFTEENIAKRQKRIAEKTTNENYLVAKVNGAIVGFCFSTKDENRNQLGAIYVLPEFQGKGVGTSLWGETLAFMDSSKDTYVEVADYNHNAITFYKRLGFVDTGRRFTNERFTMKSGAMIPEMEMVIKAGSQDQ